MIRDTVFEQHYQRKVNHLIQNAFATGVNEGVSKVLNIVLDISEGGTKPVNFHDVLAALSIKTAKDLNLDLEDPKPEQPKKQKPKLEIVK